MFRLVVVLVGVSFFATCAMANSIKLEQADFTDPEVLIETARFCSSPNGYREDGYERLCSWSFTCTDGGCIADVIFVIVDANKEEEFLEFTSRPFVTRQERRPELELLDRQELVQWPWHPDPRTLSQEIVVYEVNTLPGYDVGLILELRQANSIVFDAMRFGRAAGLPPFSLHFSEEQFYEFRGVGAVRLRPIVQKAFEKYLGMPCGALEPAVCTVVASQGRVKVNLLVPGSGLTGRPDHWERSEWYIYPTQTFAAYYELMIDVPITNIRRWPTNGVPPSGGFTSVDNDKGFELLRQEIAGNLVESLDASFPPWTQ